jgi:hypothetical protein
VRPSLLNQTRQLTPLLVRQHISFAAKKASKGGRVVEIVLLQLAQIVPKTKCTNSVHPNLPQTLATTPRIQDLGVSVHADVDR